MNRLFPGLEMGASTRAAFEEAVRGVPAGSDIVALGADEVGALVEASAGKGARVAVPADAGQTSAAVRAAATYDGRSYVRVDDRPAPVIYEAESDFAFGRADTIREGTDVTVLATGIMLAAAVVAHARLAELGVSARVLDMASLRPLDTGAVVRAAQETGALVTAEAQWIHGGLGSLAARLVAERHPVPMEFVGLDDTHAGASGADALLEHGLTAAHVMGAVHDVMERKARPVSGPPS